ncbi:hypothetical protein [Listeria seeligeri]|uniref:hypothetical protein n=1 Tax=Listeria seeligeri TaxID=1640 RepID=UPI001886E2F7|nr:hypothetical protein [Listeria seeligeri]MBF2543733.1 hypothetical protein [Listeria seeligeri]MBF2643004.1 hypothetical protein [Listeria seeligeri]
MSNNSKANLAIFIAILSFMSINFSFIAVPSLIGIIWLTTSIIVLVVMIILLIMLNKQAKNDIEAAAIPLETTITWWETSGSAERGIMFYLVLSIPQKRKQIERAYSTSGGIGIVELTQFLNQHPFGSKLTILTNGKDLKVIVLEEIQLVMSNHGEKLILERFHKSKTR